MTLGWSVYFFCCIPMATETRAEITDYPSRYVADSFVESELAKHPQQANIIIFLSLVEPLRILDDRRCDVPASMRHMVVDHDAESLMALEPGYGNGLISAARLARAAVSRISTIPDNVLPFFALEGSVYIPPEPTVNERDSVRIALSGLVDNIVRTDALTYEVHREFVARAAVQVQSVVPAALKDYQFTRRLQEATESHFGFPKKPHLMKRMLKTLTKN